MTMQARFSEADKRLYNINRDVAHCFVPVVQMLAQRLEDGKWPAVSTYLNLSGASQDDLGAACRSLILFLAVAGDPKYKDMHAALHASGWFDVSEPAQVALMAYLGTVMAGVFFSGAREASVGGDSPFMTLQDAAAAGREAYNAIASTWIERTYRKLKRMFKRSAS